jgi:hypothetical protein
MTTTLGQVLQAFEETGTGMRLDDLSRKLGIDPGTLDSMIQHWVRKGRIRRVEDPGGECGSCGVKGKCPFVVQMPRYYELATGGDDPRTETTGCCARRDFA